MPRKPRCRCIGAFPDYWTFGPEEPSAETVVMSLDEYETIRLIDKEGKTQEECALSMGVARTTITAIYDSARRKIAQALVDGMRLQISGGAYQLSGAEPVNVTMKGSNTMRIAVTFENGNIFQHFGHTEQFKLYDVEDGKIVNSQIIDSTGSGHGALAGFLKMADVDALICGGIGMGAQMALAEAGIKLYGGVQGDADAAAKALAEGKLEYDPDARCDHHDHEHGGHDCGHGGHECGHGSCHS
jgi:Predicted DNA-binding proteins